ncbi:MAG: glycosyltransferase family 4 protein [Enterococcus sp.]|nr:glycosyltransferase family 4 protein [Enterococcus sp.]
MLHNSGKYILITSANFPDGGPAASYLNLFCRGLKINNIDIQVYLLKGYAFGENRNMGPRKNITTDKIPYTYLGFRQRPENTGLKLVDLILSLLRLSILLLSLLRSHKKTTIVLYNSEFLFNLPILVIKKLTQIRLVKFSAEIIDRSQYKNTLTGRISRISHKAGSRMLGKMPDKLIVFSYYLKDEFKTRGFQEKDILVQPNLTDFKFWHVDDLQEKFTIGYSGAPYMKDGLHDLLKAVSLLTEKGRMIKVVIIGDATFGVTLIPALRDECIRLGLEDKVTFTGLVKTEEVKMYLSQCKILAITRPDTIQTRSGFPTKLGEYFAMKKPILATRFGDMEKYFEDRVDLVYAECGNPESIMRKIEWIIDNQEKTKEIALRGFETAKQLLDYRIGIEKILKFLNGM